VTQDVGSGPEAANESPLRRLAAELDRPGGATKNRVRAALGRLTSTERAELLRDRPDGGQPYSIRLRILSSRELRSIVLPWPADPEALLGFLRRHWGGGGIFRDLRYEEIAPVIRAASPGARARLHTAPWSEAFWAICDDNSIAEAMRDLLLTPRQQREWRARRRRS
jgi:hypothetical protein